MIKTNYHATIFAKNKFGFYKKVAERRVFKSEYAPEKEFITLKNELWDVDELLKEGYRIYYRFIPSHYGSFGVLDVALSNPFERKCRA